MRRALEEMVDARAPGLSGWQPAHARAMLCTPSTQEPFLQWCNAWLAGSLPLLLCSALQRVLCVPLDKGGGCPRPLLLAETLLKVPSSAAHRVLSVKILEAFVKADQYSGGVRGGAESLLTEVRASLRRTVTWLRCGLTSRTHLAVLCVPRRYARCCSGLQFVQSRFLCWACGVPPHRCLAARPCWLALGDDDGVRQAISRRSMEQLALVPDHCRCQWQSDGRHSGFGPPPHGVIL